MMFPKYAPLLPHPHDPIIFPILRAYQLLVMNWAKNYVNIIIYIILNQNFQYFSVD